MMHTQPAMTSPAPSAPPALAPLDYQPRTRLVFGNGSVARIGELAQEFGRKVLLVTDAGIVQAGHAGRVRDSLQAAGLQVTLFDDVRENPTTHCVAKCVDIAAKAGIELIVGLGGGSSMDTAKGTNFILTNGGRMEDYWGFGKATQAMLPLIAIPTTGGTGSECQSYALISDEKTHRKMACGDPKAAARIALLDPELTISMPPRVTACTGIDAIAHAVETAVTLKRNPLSIMSSHEAFKLTARSLARVIEQPNDLEARGRMLLGAAFAGTAIENSMLGAVHSAANPLTAHFGVVHGEAVGLLLPHVIRFNARDPATRLAYAELASAPEIACVSDGLDSAVDALIRHIESLLQTLGLPRTLREREVTREMLPRLAEEASQQWTAKFNPRPITSADFLELYEAAY